MRAERAYVPNMSSPARMTADELLHVRIPDKRVELVRGSLVVRRARGDSRGRGGARWPGFPARVQRFSGGAAARSWSYTPGRQVSIISRFIFRGLLITSKNSSRYWWVCLTYFGSSSGRSL